MHDVRSVPAVTRSPPCPVLSCPVLSCPVPPWLAQSPGLFSCQDLLGTRGEEASQNHRESDRQTDRQIKQLSVSQIFFSEPVWPSGKSGDFVPHNYETLKWLSSLPILMQESYWRWRCSHRYIISLSPHPHNPFPPCPRPY